MKCITILTLYHNFVGRDVHLKPCPRYLVRGYTVESSLFKGDQGLLWVISQVPEFLSINSLIYK